jgi:hypothetical protein
MPSKQQNHSFIEKEEKHRGDETRGNALREEGDQQRKVKIGKRGRVEDGQQDDDEEALQEGGEKDKENLEWEALQIETAPEVFHTIEEKGSGEGVKADGVSGKEIHQVSQNEYQDSSRNGRVRECQINDEDEKDVRSEALNVEGRPEGGLDGQKKDSEQKGREEPSHFFFRPPDGVFPIFFSFSPCAL